MNPTMMLTLLVAAWAAFAWSANRRWQLLKVGRSENRIDHIGTRLKVVYDYALAQKKMRYYPLAGLAHQVIFLGFSVFAPAHLDPLGSRVRPNVQSLYLGRRAGSRAAARPHLRVHQRRVRHAGAARGGRLLLLPGHTAAKAHVAASEGLVILGIIASMMVGDMLVRRRLDRAFASVLRRPTAARRGRSFRGSRPGAHHPRSHGARRPGRSFDVRLLPLAAGSLFALLLSGLGMSSLVFVAHFGFWMHSTLVLVFLNILPHSKHFHIITALPNAFASDLTPRGRLRPMAASSEKLMEMVGAAAEKTDPLEDPVGVARIEHFTWKAILDFYTCTECGRCSDNCPAHRTGKILSPKHLTLDLRDHLYAREQSFSIAPAAPRASTAKPRAARAPKLVAARAHRPTRRHEEQPCGRE